MRVRRSVAYFKTGAGNGAIGNAVFTVHPGHLGQWQECGRDQGHTRSGIGLMGAFCEMAWNQGDDLYGYDDNRFLAAAEYVAKYNLGNDVPLRNLRQLRRRQSDGHLGDGAGRGPSHLGAGLQPLRQSARVGCAGRGGLCGTRASEGGGGDYGPNSGGYDQLGYGTLTATVDAMMP